MIEKEKLGPNTQIDWDMGNVEFAGDQIESNAETNETSEKIKQLNLIDSSLQNELFDQIGDVKAGDGGEPMYRRLAESCWENHQDLEGDNASRRQKALSEVSMVQDFMFLEESQNWLPEDSEAKKQLVELFSKTYALTEGVEMDAFSAKQGNLSDYTSKANIEALSPRLQDINREISDQISEEYLADTNDPAARKQEFVGFAKMVLGEDSKEYQLVLEEAYHLGERTENVVTKKEEMPVTYYMSSLGGSETPMRLAAKLTTPFAVHGREK
jgi:hypothetical protein